MTLLHFLKAIQNEENITWQKTCETFAKNLSDRKNKISWKSVDNIAYGRIPPSALLSSKIVYASAGMVKFEELRPDILIFLKKCGEKI